MALEVPKEPKVYTTIYDNFKGVDFTSDASNVFKRRSPTGTNMLPNLDGKPYKRTGWKIEVSASELKSAAGVSDSVAINPEKTHYFEVGSKDYLMIFNNLGVFAYAEGVLTHLTYYRTTSGTKASFPPSGSLHPIDSRRSFFFEGGGTAGFYILVGTRMFIFDGTFTTMGGDDVWLEEVAPKIPIVLIGCDQNGAGTMYEPVNMLTRERTISYSGLPKGNKAFKFFGGYSTLSVQTRNLSTGDWEDNANFTASTSGTNITTVTMTTAPIGTGDTFDGEDTLRITYDPDTTHATSVSDSVVSVNRHFTKHVYEYAYELRDPATGEIVAESGRYTEKTDYEWEAKKDYNIPNVAIDTLSGEKDVHVELRESDLDTWHTLSDNPIKFGAYNSTVETTPNDEYVTRATEISENETRTAHEYSGMVSGREQYINRWRTDIVYKVDEKIAYKRAETWITEYESGGGVVTMRDDARCAFTACTRCLVFGSGIINQVFLAVNPYDEYNSRVWYSQATDPTYFPDTNYIEAGASDKPIVGMIPIGAYLGIIKKGASNEASVYLAYPTTFDNDTTYAIKQSINGIGAIANGAFNIMNDEPLFLSREGVMAVSSTESGDHQLQNRSAFVNGKLTKEDGMFAAISFVHRGMYYLAINGRCYVLDGAQKNSWVNTKSNLQYECYYLENIPAQCFAKANNNLYFTDYLGNLCRFKAETEVDAYTDWYSIGKPAWTSPIPPVDDIFDGNELSGSGTEFGLLLDENFVVLSDENDEEIEIVHSRAAKDDTILYDGAWYTVISASDENSDVYARLGVPIEAEWSTIADDDGAVHYFKNLKKKGTVISLLPASDSGVDVYIKADNKEAVLVGSTDAVQYVLPFDFYSKKKIKKYKRLQIICRNRSLNDSFGVDQIIKSYTVGNYSKNKR